MAFQRLHLAILLVISLLSPSIAHSQSTPLSDLDALRYIASHSDLIQAFGADAQKGREHYENNGIKEGRKITFETWRYMASHSDVIRAFGLDPIAGTRHYITNGYREARKVDFESFRYIASHSDLISAIGLDAEAGARHYVGWGYREERKITFPAYQYLASYPDLMDAFGDDTEAASRHYIGWGVKEGRSITFSPWEYLASNFDLIEAFGEDINRASKHYVTTGRREGRRTSFDGLSYIASYEDLSQALGTEKQAGASHFARIGYREGRSIYFDPAVYLSLNSDVNRVYGTNLDEATSHYIRVGRSEGRDIGAPKLELSDRQLYFYANNSASFKRSFDIFNKGNLVLKVGPFTFEDPSPELSQENNCGGRVEPGSTCKVTVTFDLTPTSSRSKLRIKNNAGFDLQGKYLKTETLGEDVLVDLIPLVGSSTSMLPGAPQNLRGIPWDEGAILLFDPPKSDGGIPILQYRAQCGGNARSFSVTGRLAVTPLTNNSEVACQVAAINAAGEGPLSNAISIRPTELSKFATLTGSLSDNNRRVTLAWSDVFPAGTSYRVESCADCSQWNAEAVIESTGSVGAKSQWSGVIDRATEYRIYAVTDGLPRKALKTVDDAFQLSFVNSDLPPVIRANQSEPLRETAEFSLSSTYTSAIWTLGGDRVVSLADRRGNWARFDTRKLPDGTHTVTAKVQNGTDRISEISKSFKIDNSPPLTVQTPSSSRISTGNYRISVGASPLDKIQSVEMFFRSQSLGVLTAPNCGNAFCWDYYSGSTTSGTYPIEVKVTPKTGDPIFKTGSIQIGDPPVLTLTTPVKDGTYGLSLRLIGQVTLASAEPVRTIATLVHDGAGGGWPKIEILNTTSRTFDFVYLIDPTRFQAPTAGGRFWLSIRSCGNAYCSQPIEFGINVSASVPASSNSEVRVPLSSPTAVPSSAVVARSPTRDVKQSNNNASTASASESEDPRSGSVYRLSRKISPIDISIQDWTLEYRSNAGSVFANYELPSTSNVLWRRGASALDLPTTSWVRACGDRVWVFQDGYALLGHVAAASLHTIKTIQLNLSKTAEVTLLTDVQCASAGAVRVIGSFFEVSGEQPQLRYGNGSANRFAIDLDQTGVVRSRQTYLAPFSLKELCERQISEHYLFCKSIQSTGGW